MPTFVRVAHRHGWDVEVVGSDGAVQSTSHASRDDALAYAESLAPDWIEVGEIVDLGMPTQHHSWSTLRRGANGLYAPSALRWQGGGISTRAGQADDTSTVV